MESNNHFLKIKEISCYRKELFGIAILSIIGLHYLEGVSADFSHSYIMYIFSKIYFGSIGSVGVDIFLFLSGYGIYYSLSHEQNIFSFYEKRVKRVVLPYFIFGILFWVLEDIIMLRVSVGEFLLDFSTISFWTRGNRMYWYISLICLLYLISPFLYRHKNKISLVILVWILGCVVLYFFNANYFNKIEIALLRVPAFCFGLYFADLAEKNVVIGKRMFYILLFAIPVKIIVVITNFAFARFFNSLYAIILIVLYVLFRKKFLWENMFTLKFLSYIGHFTLELYLFHVGLRSLSGFIDVSISMSLLLAILMIISFPMAILFSKFEHVLWDRRWSKLK